MSRMEIPLGVLCHRYEVLRPRRKPAAWRKLFAECPMCLRSMLLAAVPSTPEMIFWCCPPCIERANAMWRSLV